MDEAPKGYKRMESGALTFAPTFGFRDYHTEAIWFSDGSGDRFGCTAKVRSSGMSRSHHCGKTAKHDPDERGNPIKCGVHSSAAAAKRKAKSDAHYQAQKDRRERQNAITDLRRETESIVRQIAAGHNDPRSLCADWVARMKSVQEGKL